MDRTNAEVLAKMVGGAVEPSMDGRGWHVTVDRGPLGFLSFDGVGVYQYASRKAHDDFHAGVETRDSPLLDAVEWADCRAEDRTRIGDDPDELVEESVGARDAAGEVRTVQEDGRILCVDGLSAWIYDSEAAYLAWHLGGDDSGVIALSADTEEQLSDLCERYDVVGR